MKYIIILFTRIELLNLSIPFSEISARSFTVFNEKETNLLVADYDMGYMATKLCFTHPEFDEFEWGMTIPVFCLDEAKKRYPFLFADTNPILYRRFK